MDLILNYGLEGMIGWQVCIKYIVSLCLTIYITHKKKSYPNIGGDYNVEL